MDACEGRSENFMKNEKIVTEKCSKNLANDVIVRIEVFATVVGMSAQFLAWKYPLCDLVIEGVANSDDTNDPVIAD